MPETRYTARDGGDFMAYVAMPDTLPAPAIVIIQEIFGVNGFLRTKADELASKGFIAVVPDLFWRIEPGVQLTDKTQEEWNRAFALMNAFDIDQGISDIADVIAAVRKDENCTGKVGCQGYCLGGKLAYLTAARTDVDASVSYYGVGLDALLGEASGIQKPLLMHIAEKDQFVPKDAQAKIIDALKDNPLVTIHTYPGMDHAFTRIGGAHFDADAAGLANGRSNDFLRTYLD
jgi:carboxymethylenebutenolidase